MPKDKLALLGEYLRSVRNNANLTQEQLSDLSHVSIKHIADIEKGLKNPSFVGFAIPCKSIGLIPGQSNRGKSQYR